MYIYIKIIKVNLNLIHIIPKCVHCKNMVYMVSNDTAMRTIDRNYNIESLVQKIFRGTCHTHRLITIHL